MIVLGALSLVCGGCSLIGVMNPPTPEQMEEFRKAFPGMQMPEPTHQAVGTFVALAAGAIMLVLGLFVRRGGRGAIITSLIMLGLVLAWNAVGLLALPGLAPAVMAVQVCATLIVMTPVVLAFVWLIRALRNPSQVPDPQAQYAAYQQQYYQQWQQYQQMQPQQQTPGQGLTHAPTQPSTLAAMPPEPPRNIE